VVKAGSSDFADMILHRQLAIQSDSEIVYGVDTLNESCVTVRDDVPGKAVRF